MIVKHESRAARTGRQNDLTPPLGKDQLRNMIARFPEEVEEEMSDHYWGTAETYYETYFNIPPKD